MESLARKIRAALPASPGAVESRDGTVVIRTPDPLVFWGQFLHGLEHGCRIVLMDPTWPAAWAAELGRIVAGAGSRDPGIWIPTSGTTGLPKFCIHDTATLSAAAGGFADSFGARGIVHAVNVLPQHHVGGLMPVFRSALCGGQVHFAAYGDADSLKAAPFPLQAASLSVVPTQLRRMLDEPVLAKVLQSFGLILIGGAACPPDLLVAARALGLRLAPCYGSTETAAMVTALAPEAFLAGKAGVGGALPHARIEVDRDGRVLVHSPSNLRGYRPPGPEFSREPFVTGDLGQWHDDGSLGIIGRADRVIISGGEKVHPELVEAAAMATGLLEAAHCAGVPDPDWGTRVELTVVPRKASPDIRDKVETELRQALPPYAAPKKIHLLEAASGLRTTGK